jgi:hypothetical protein
MKSMSLFLTPNPSASQMYSFLFPGVRLGNFTNFALNILSIGFNMAA